MFKNICLVGLPHSGKSLLGKKLALIKNKGFIETDKIIEYKYNNCLKNIITNNGVNNFLKIENNIGKTIHCENNIISTGGSMIYNKDAMLHFKNNLECKIIHLELTLPEFKLRMNDFNERGVINKFNLSIEEFYFDRLRLYNSYSDLVINSNDINIAYKRLLDEW